MKTKEFFGGLVIGAIAGALLVITLQPYSIVQTHVGAGTFKINKLTGETWVFRWDSYVWFPIQNAN